MKTFNMKKTILFLSLAAIVVTYFNCSSDSTINNPVGGGSLTSISGTVENWTLGSKTIMLGVYGWSDYSDTIAAVSTIGANGSFSFTNLPILTNNGLGLILFPNDTICSGNMTVNPSGLKVGFAYIDVYNTPDSTIGSIVKANGANYGNGYIQTYHGYFSDAGNISGNYNCNYWGWQYEQVWNANFPAKWYYVFIKYDSLGSNHYKYTINNSEPSGMKWYYISYYTDNNRDVGRRSFLREKIYNRK